MRAATAVRATTNGSIADRICEESFFTETSDKLSGFVPNDKNVKLPSLLCNPTFPINGYEVEQAKTDNEQPLELFETLVTGATRNFPFLKEIDSNLS